MTLAVAEALTPNKPIFVRDDSACIERHLLDTLGTSTLAIILDLAQSCSAHFPSVIKRSPATSRKDKGIVSRWSVSS